MPGTPPGPDGIVQQELHHVVFGEQLRHRGQGSTVDLLAALVDLILPLGLPELVDPAQAVVGQERFLSAACEQLFQSEAMLRGELDLQQHVVGAEDLRQHLAGVAGRQREAVGRPFRLWPVPRIPPG